LEGFAEALRAEHAGSGIAVSVLNPSDVDTGFYHRALLEGLLDRSDARATQRRGMPVSVVADAVVALVTRPRRQQFLPARRQAIAALEACVPTLTGRLLVKRPAPRVDFGKATVALITGASSGIGRALAHRLLARGLTVVLVARDGSRLAEAARGWSGLPGRALPLSLDLRDPDAVREAIAALADTLHRRIDLLVNNAGYSVRGSVLDVPIDKYAENLQTNYFGPIVLMRAVLPWMQARGQGQIVNMLSTTAVRGVTNLSSYCATKFALRAVSRCADRELTAAGANIRVTEVLPGNVDTGFFEHVEQFGGTASGRPPRAALVEDVVSAVMRHLDRGATSSFVPIRGLALQVGRAAFPSLLDALEGWRAARHRARQARRPISL
jgi:short-subunit dehydrogenase